MINQSSLFTTERLVLRPLKQTDARAVYLLRSDEAINKYIDRPAATAEQDGKDFIDKIHRLSAEGKTLYRAITLKEDDQLIGTVTIWNFDEAANKAEIGYELMTQYQGNGYMRETLEAIIRYAFDEIKLSALEAWTHPENNASMGLLERLGFTKGDVAQENSRGGVQESFYTLQNPHHS